MRLYDPDNQLLKELNTGRSGNEKLGAAKDGEYRIEVTGNRTQGSYEVTYRVE